MGKTATQAYDELIRRVKEIAVLESCGSLLQWDQQTQMPPKGSAHRAEQLALIAGLTHGMFTAAEIGELLAAVEGGGLTEEAGSVRAVNIRELRRSYDRETKIPPALVRELARTCALAQNVWVEARRTCDFSLFRPWLEKLVALKRQQAEALGYTTVPYDPLLDGYEPGETTARLSALFADLQKDLVPLVRAIAESGRRPSTACLHREYAIDQQEVFGRAVSTAIGFDFQAGRLDVTTHPFCSGIGPGDTRLTTRYNPNDFGDAFFSIMHESGHALYDQGLDPEHFGTPMGMAVSLGIHESQSRLWENLVGRSRTFWEAYFPRAQSAFPRALRDVSLDTFYFAINEVRPSFIRVDADEATYNLHIMLRFELERALLEGDLKPGDVPGAWNERFRQLFGMIPPDDARGCLQDIHWSGGGIGYFPTYTLGNLYASQFFAQARKDLGDLDGQFRRGEFRALKDWLNGKIHRQGQRYRAAELVAAVTGEPLSPGFFLDHLRAKYGPLYGI